MPTSTKYALPYPSLTDNADVPEDIGALANGIDGKMAGWLAGTTAARPAAGVAGRIYRETDADRLDLDTGSAWRKILYQVASGDYVADAPVDATALKISGTALASTHLSDTAQLARLASPAFTGNPTAPNQSGGDNDTSIANTAFVTAAVAAHAAASPAHAASAVSYAGSAGLSSSNVEAALDELDSEKASQSAFDTLSNLVNGFTVAWTEVTAPDIIGSSTNPNLGTTGEKKARYVKIGRTVIAHYSYRWGGTGCDGGSGFWTVPVLSGHTKVGTPITNNHPVRGSGQIGLSAGFEALLVIKDSSGSTQQFLLTYPSSLTVIGNVGSGLGTYGAGSQLNFCVTYETTS